MNPNASVFHSSQEGCGGVTPDDNEQYATSATYTPESVNGNNTPATDAHHKSSPATAGCVTPTDVSTPVMNSGQYL